MCVFGELRIPEVCVSSELRTQEVSVLSEFRTPEFCFTIESGVGKITLFNGEVAQGIENGCAAKVELKSAPCVGGNGYLLALIHADIATMFAHFLKNGEAYVLFFVELYIVCANIFRLFVLTRIFKTPK